MDQSHFSERYPHFLLHKVKDKKPKIPRPKGSKFFPEKSNTKEGILTNEARVVKHVTESRKKIFRDDRLFFIVQFSDSIKLGSVQSALDSLGGRVTRVYDDAAVKIAIMPFKYEQFVDALEKKRSLIVTVKQSDSSDKFDQSFLNTLQSNEGPQNVTIEVGDLSGLSYTDALDSALKKYVKKTNGHIELGYSSDSFAIFSGKLLPEVIKEIAEQVEVVENVEAVPKIALTSYGNPSGEDVKLSSVISLSRETRKEGDVPTVCVIDGGVNETHAILNENIISTYDFTTNSEKPCIDNDGHGSMVSGITIYGGDARSNTQVLSNVLMVKGFEGGREVDDIMRIIDKTTSFFAKKTKIFNFSFSALGPNRALSKMLDDLIYSKNLIVVASAGNIDHQQIEHSLETGKNYPDYLQDYPIFFPGDSQNVITVGASTRLDSNWIRRNHPSPFTRAGTSIENIKPDVIFDGGNVSRIDNGDGTHSHIYTNMGVKSASHNNLLKLSEGVGTSFSAPAVATIAANILQRYNFVLPHLVKALILSSSGLLKNANNQEFGYNIQGFGVPDLQICIQSIQWRVCYLLQGSFDGTDLDEVHRYKFLFPDNADKVTVTFVVGRPPNSQGYFRYKLIKSGNKPTSSTRPNHKIGKKPIYTTHGAIYNVKRGGKGEWSFEVNPHFDKNISADRSLRYGCVITIESTKSLDVYTPIKIWMESEQNRVQKEQVVVDERLRSK